MVGLTSAADMDIPLGIILVSKDDTAERVLFMYPFESEYSTMTEASNDGKQDVSSTDNGEGRSMGHIQHKLSHPSVTVRDVRYGVPVKMLAPLLCPKDGDRSAPFEIKVDNVCFAGYPWRSAGSSRNLAVVFALPGSVESHVVESFQNLSKKIATAIQSEQLRCNYLRQQIAIMQPAHDEVETMSDEHRKRSPYPTILEKSILAQQLKDIFEDVREYGSVDVIVDCVEVGLCVEPKALTQAGLTPKSSKELEAVMRQVRPYHGVLFLEDNVKQMSSKPFEQFLAAHEVNRSIEEISVLSGLPLSQVLQIVRHYLMWARAVVFYPICHSNVYTTAQTPASFTTLATTFSHQFPDTSLAEVIQQFSPPCTLGTFLQETALYTSINVSMQMIVFLLRNQLLVQLHTFMYLLAPMSNHKIPELDGSLLSPRIMTSVNGSKLLDAGMKEWVLRICTQAMQAGVNEPELFMLTSTFLSLAPYLDGRHHIEDIMFRTQVDRSNVTRVLDTFAALLSPFYCQDLIIET